MFFLLPLWAAVLFLAFIENDFRFVPLFTFLLFLGVLGTRRSIPLRIRSAAQLRGAIKVRRFFFTGILGLWTQYLLALGMKLKSYSLFCPSFPSCGESFLPSVIEGYIPFFHRWFGVIMAGLFVHLLIVAYRYLPELKRLAWAGTLLTLFQVGLGVANIVFALHPIARNLHAMNGYVLALILTWMSTPIPNLKRLKAYKEQFPLD